MEDIVSQTKAEFVRAKDRMVHLLATTPEEKVNWSPSPSARTPVQLVAHAAMICPLAQGMVESKPFPYKTISEFDAGWRKAETEYTTREQALSLLEKNSAEYLAWLDTLTPAQLGTTVDTIFGALPVPVAIGLVADHTRGHTQQMDYLQTVWGDHDWHL